MEWCTTESGKYRIESLSAATFPGALKVLKEAHLKDEASHIGSELNKDPECTQEFLEIFADRALDGVSLVAVAVDSGEVAAVAFNKLKTALSCSPERTFLETFETERCTRPSFRSVRKFLNNVEGRCNLFQKYQTDCCFEIGGLATLREHRGQNLATLLCKVSIEVAKKLKDGPVATFTLKDLGPQFAHIKPRDVTNKIPSVCVAISTSEFMQRIGKKQGFKVEAKVFMKDFIYDGKTYADRLGNQSAFAELVALELN